MEMIGTENFGAYARKMLIDGYIIVVDYTEQKKLAAEINKIGVNINSVCRRINSTGRFYQDDIDELKAVSYTHLAYGTTVGIHQKAASIL